jgi:hypothetical protein
LKGLPIDRNGQQAKFETMPPEAFLIDETMTDVIFET